MDSGSYNYDLENIHWKQVEVCQAAGYLHVKIFWIHILAVRQHSCQTQLQRGDTMQSTLNLKVAVAFVLFSFHTTTTDCGKDSAS